MLTLPRSHPPQQRIGSSHAAEMQKAIKAKQMQKPAVRQVSCIFMAVDNFRHHSRQYMDTEKMSRRRNKNGCVYV